MTITLNFAPVRPGAATTLSKTAPKEKVPYRVKKALKREERLNQRQPRTNTERETNFITTTILNKRKLTGGGGPQQHNVPAEFLKPVTGVVDRLLEGDEGGNRRKNKRVNREESFKPVVREGTQEENNEGDSETLESQEASEPQAGPKTIISSLFTKNPRIGKEHLKESHIVPQQASNGILSDAPNFVAAGLDKVLANHLFTKMGMGKPTTVQSQVLSFIDSSGYRDLIVQAQTGSGKTLSFLLPIVDRLIRASGAVHTTDSFRPDRTSGVLAVILAPTRELAKQIYDVLTILLNYPVVSDKTLQRYHWIVPGLVVGGDKKASEKARLRKGVNILVATPGRFLDHLQNTRCMHINSLKWLVLDEGDRFLELGLQETLKTIFTILNQRQQEVRPYHRGPYRGSWFWESDWLPRTRMTMMVSATLNSAVHTLAEYSLTDPFHITKGDDPEDGDSDDGYSESGVTNPGNNTFATPQQLTQRYLVVPAKLRLVTLLSLLKSAIQKGHGKVIVFLLTCDEVEFYHNLFSKTILNSDEPTADIPDVKEVPGYFTGAEKFFNLGQTVPKLPLLKLHGSMDQSCRSGTYQAFCKFQSGVLFCTDVAARGLDLPLVTEIIQFDPPTDIKDYVHRVGRTARLGKAGGATLFLLPSEIDYLNHLASLKIHLHPGTAEEALKSLAGPAGEDYQSAATFYQNAFEKQVLSSPKQQALADSALQSSIRAYATHPSSEKTIFHIKRLHLGHWAKSFALREAPTSITRRTGKQAQAQAQAASGDKKKSSHPSYASTQGSRPSAGYHDPTSEFASGSLSSRGKPPSRRR